MTFLGFSLFYQNTPVAAAPNAAPSIPASTLNFDFGGSNTAPAGSNHSLSFDVAPANAAPSIPAATLNFDFGGSNTAPAGSNQALSFDVTAS